MRIKVCGATSPADIELLAGLGVDFVGLWFGIPGGRADLPLDEVRQLTALAQATGGPEPVLVTFLSDAEALSAGVLRSGVRWLQLHGYQPPMMVRGLKALVPEAVRVVKVLHVAAGHCLERSLIRSYERAGVDLFLVDAVTSDGRVGSTGQQLDPQVVLEVLERTTRPCILAGGISAENRRDFGMLAGHPRLYGIDVDTGARAADATLSADRIAAIGEAWKTGVGSVAS